MARLRYQDQTVNFQSANQPEDDRGRISGPLHVARILVASLICFCCSGCALFSPFKGSDSIVEARLNGRGPVYVSSDNPYLAANLFLKSAAAKSADFAGFLKLRGNPSRIEYSRRFLSEPNLVLYYDQTHESYNSIYTNGVWVFEAQRSESLRGLQVSQDQTPTAIIPPEKKAPPRPTNSKSFSSQAIIAPPGALLSAAVNKCRKLSGLQAAERSPAGDLIHYVVDDRETAFVIAEWYTGETATADSILRLNKFATKKILSVGDQLVIPKYLVKNGDQLGSSALRCMLTEKAINP